MHSICFHTVYVYKQFMFTHSICLQQYMFTHSNNLHTVHVYAQYMFPYSTCLRTVHVYTQNMFTTEHVYTQYMFAYTQYMFTQSTCVRTLRMYTELQYTIGKIVSIVIMQLLTSVAIVGAVVLYMWVPAPRARLLGGYFISNIEKTYQY